VARLKDFNWNMRGSEGSGPKPADCVTANLLMDIRDELKELNETLRVLRCRDFLLIPATLRGIRANTDRKRKR
jgi:hypothetical protein